MSLVYDATFGDSVQVTQTEKDVNILIDFGVQFITLSCVIKAKDLYIISKSKQKDRSSKFYEVNT